MILVDNINKQQNFYTNNLPNIDYKAFADDLNKIKNEINTELSEKDFKHLKKIERWGRACTFFGYSTSWIIPNPISAFLISQGNITRWLMITHHITHKGYDKVPDIPERYTSKKYAIGIRRFVDWLDWIIPEAWNQDHNILHHYYTGEVSDPDLVEQSMEMIRKSKIPIFIKYLITIFIISTWKIIYFAPTTLYILHRSKRTDLKNREIMEKLPSKNHTKSKLLIGFFKGSVEFLLKSILPYFSVRFILIPMMFLPLGKKAALFVLINSILAELIINIHSFLIVFPSHAGDDICRYDTGITDISEFYVRQVAGSVNYNCGNDLNDFFHGWLNYQIEHHLFPDIPMLKYQEYQGKIKEVCEKHHLPYVQENVFKRFFKLLNIMVGKTDMKKTSTIPRKLRA